MSQVEPHNGPSGRLLSRAARLTPRATITSLPCTTLSAGRSPQHVIAHATGGYQKLPLRKALAPRPCAAVYVESKSFPRANCH